MKGLLIAATGNLFDSNGDDLAHRWGGLAVETQHARETHNIGKRHLSLCPFIIGKAASKPRNSVNRRQAVDAYAV